MKQNDLEIGIRVSGLGFGNPVRGLRGEPSVISEAPIRNPQGVHPPRRAIRNPHAFTLIELMIVVMIMVIIVGLIIGVAYYVNKEAARKQALSNEALITSAINTFFSAHGIYPTQTPVPKGGCEDSTAEWWTHTQGNSYPLFPPQAMRNMWLMTQLMGKDEPSKAALARLPSSYFGIFTDVFNGNGNSSTSFGDFRMSVALPACFKDSNGNPTDHAVVLLDGFGTLFDYQDGTNPKNTCESDPAKQHNTPGSVSGSFVFISAGPDGAPGAGGNRMRGFNDPIYNIYSSDDVRSDVH
jgi:prepilin-type N-terminal cleavage/methylation domain-containing protein